MGVIDMLPKKLKPMSLLPNQDGFEFTGIKRNGAEVDCFVKFSMEGQYIVLTKYTFNRVFNELQGWI